jgi:hypothetical protein
MLSIEYKPGPGMIEILDRSPSLRRMARRALLFEFPAMRIAVAGIAGGREPEIRPVGVRREHFLHAPVDDRGGCMAAITGDRPVAASEAKAGLIMVEAPFVELDRLRILPKMFLVARDAYPGSNAKMKPMFGRYGLLNLRMASEAFCAADFAPDFVALDAVLRPLEGLMRPGKVSGRELPVCQSGYHLPDHPEEDHPFELSFSEPSLLHIIRRSTCIRAAMKR